MGMGAAAALIGGGWQVVTRQATTTSLAPEDLVILRYGIPALLLLPLTLRAGLWPTGLSWRMLVLLVAGAGLPFGFVAMSGTRYAPVSHMGILMAGASPLIAAALAWLLWRELPDRSRAGGLALMLLGIGLLGWHSLSGWSADTWRGDVLFLLAALLWAGYTLGFRRSGLSPWQAAGLVNLWSAGLVLVWAVLRGGTRLLEAPPVDLAWQVAWQGVLAGVLGLWTFSVAIKHLGAAHAAAFGALAPVVSALGGWWWLGEALTLLDVLAIGAVVAGVLMASAVFTPSRPRRVRPTRTD